MRIKKALFLGLSVFACGILFEKLFASDMGELFLVALGIFLWSMQGKGWWMWPLGLALPFYGKNPSFYQSVPFDTYLLTIICLSLCKQTVLLLFSKNKIEKNPIIKQNEWIWRLGLALCFWVVFRSLDNLQVFINDCSLYGKRECIRSLFIAHSGSEFLGLRTSLSWLLGLGFAYILACDPSAIKQGIYSLLASSVVTTLVALRHLDAFSLPVLSSICSEAYYCATFFQATYVNRFISFFGNPGWYGQYLIFVFGLSLFLCNYTYIRGKKVACFFAAAFSVLVFYEGLATIQRATWLSMAVMLVITAISYVQVMRTLEKRRDKIILVIGSGVFLFSLYFAFDAIWPALFYKWNLIPTGRDYIWYASIDAWKTQPWIGIGIGNYSEVIHRFISEEIAKNYGFPETAHNAFFHMLVETGLVGAVLFVLFNFHLIKLLFINKDQSYRWYLLVGLIGIGINSLFQEVYYARAIFYSFWILVGFIMQNPLEGLEPLPSFNRKYAYATASIFLALLAFKNPVTPYAGCYQNEIDTAQPEQYYRWCRKEAVLTFPHVQGRGISLVLGSLMDNKLHITQISNAYPTERVIEVKPGKLEKLDFYIPDTGSDSNAIVIKISAEQGKMMDDHRQLSFRINFPEQGILSNVATK